MANDDAVFDCRAEERMIYEGCPNCDSFNTAPPNDSEGRSNGQPVNGGEGPICPGTLYADNRLGSPIPDPIELENWWGFWASCTP